MRNIYCGIRQVPKNKVRGTMEECFDKGQIYYYGLNKVDPIVIDAKKRKKALTKKKQLHKLRLEYVGKNGKIKKLQGQFVASKTEKEKKDIKKEIKTLEQEMKNISKEIQVLLKEE